MADRDELIRRQQILADFGAVSLQSDDLDEVLTQACRLVAAALGTRRAKVLEIDPAAQDLLVRAGVGWHPGVVGRVRLPMGEHSSETFAVQHGEPVVMQDLRQETRFDVPQFMKDEGVVCLVNVPILLSGRKAYGLLQVDGDEPTAFDDDDVQFLRTYVAILGPVIDRLHRVTRLRQTEEQYRLVVENAPDYAIFILDAEGIITEWDVGAQAVFGYTPGEAIGQSFSVLFTPDDRDEGADGEELEKARHQGAAPDVRWHLRRDGSRVFIEGTNRALHDEQGTVTGFLKIGQDITERRRAERRLRESEKQLLRFGEAASDALWMRDAASLQFDYVSPAFQAIYGIDLEQMRKGDDVGPWAETIHAQDRDAVLNKLRLVRAGDRVVQEFRIIRPSDGELRWIRDTTFPMLDEDGQTYRIAGVGRDITAEKEAAERMKVLVAELQHRTRNLLGVIRSVADKTAAGSPSLDQFLKRYRQRLDALARVNSLLSHMHAEGPITFDQLLRTELLAHGVIDQTGAGPRIALQGPPRVKLRPTIVQTLALALHELATNAAKYGAFSTPEGRLHVAWQVEAGDEAAARLPRLRLTWKESGVPNMPSAGAAPQGTGYGRELIEKALPYQLNARTTYELTPDGVHCTIDLPLAAD